MASANPPSVITLKVIAEQVQHRHRGEQRQRHRGEHDQAGAPRTDEQQHYQCYQQADQQDLVLNGANGIIDEDRLVEDRLNAHVPGRRGENFGETCTDLAHDLHCRRSSKLDQRH